MKTSVDNLSVREIQKSDISSIVGYWMNSDSRFLLDMGVDINKMPGEEQWTKFLSEQIDLPVKSRESYCIIWLLDGRPVGHSNINKIVFAKEAYMHLHIWNADIRKKGFGVSWIGLTLPYFFKNFQLRDLYCEPYKINNAPDRTLEKSGFEYLRSYTTIPGWLNFEQEVNLWVMRKDKIKSLIQ